jgi:mannitol/fructose-specific phosphotransferase system IIA component (Ntr-type)
MKIANLLKCKNIIKISESKSKDEVLSFLINHLIDSYPEENFDDEFKQKVIDTVFERESQSTTGMGGHIAFPHGRVAGLNKPLIALGIVNDGLEYGSPDNKKVKLIFLFLFPGNRHDLGVKIQSVFARFLMADNCVERLLSTEKAEDIHQMIEDAELAIDSPIAAQDVMRNPKIRLSGDTPLLTATSKMNEFNTEVAPVVDEDGKVVGEVNCIHLFQMDLPDYIKKLHSMPPIHDFKPFNKYFSENASLMVKDVINSEIAEIEPDTSLMEIIFLLAVKKYTIVYVCEAGKLVGVIDRITVLDKVFNI